MTPAPQLEGISIPVTTPFRPDGELDLDALRTNLRKYFTTHLRGFLILGSTGEPVHVTPEERLRVIETARAEIPDSRVLIAGCGSHTTRETISWVRDAASAGAGVALVVTPFYYKGAMKPDALEQHYFEIADASPIPVMLYSVPQFTGVTIEPALVARLAQHERIAGIKDSAGNLAAISETIRLCPPAFQVLTGSPAILSGALAMGASGAILAVACAIPSLCIELFAAVREQDADRARELQLRILDFLSVVGPHGIGGIKAAMDAEGYTGGWPRKPLLPPDDKARKQIEDAVARAVPEVIH